MLANIRLAAVVRSVIAQPLVIHRDPWQLHRRFAESRNCTGKNLRGVKSARSTRCWASAAALYVRWRTHSRAAKSVSGSATHRWCASAPTASIPSCSNQPGDRSVEIHMYIGGGVLGTILVVLLIVWLVRRV